MQPWHCVLLIVLTLSLFFYGVYYQEIKEESQAPLTLSYEDDFSEPDPEVPKGSEVPDKESALEKLAESNNWAEHRVLLVVENGTPNLTSLHSDALESPDFLLQLTALLSQNPTAKEMILSPFQSNAFKQNESQIIRALFSTRKSDRRRDGIYLVCRGHSIKSSRLLTNTVMQAYRLATLEESLERPLIFRFQKYRQKIGVLEQRKLELVEQIQQSASIAKGANIEEIALQSELIETSKELAMLNETLSRIDSIHKKDPSPLALLEVERIAKYQNLPELIAMTSQLRKILGNQDTDSFVRKEVSRNLDSTMSKIVREIAGAITQLKSETKEGLKRKEVLEERMIEMRASEDSYVKSSPKYSLLERLNEEIRSQKEIYQSNFSEWKRAKNTFRFEEIEILKQEK
ncbi:MAG: hypothetical protein CMI29_02780 [Opitutae bacterium]|nr:hypothetical protein [Opitutae bacterium]|tara:strand:- start:2427 stop:3635 length:1209 start_codon:yes stop_codon:yes gene_type:complete